MMERVYGLTIFPVFILTCSVLLLICGCSPKLHPSLKEIQTTQYFSSWEKLNAYPVKRGRSDDLHFFDAETGFVINSGGYLSYTEDGGKNWEVVHTDKGTFFRCIVFKNRQEGWLGTIGQDDPYLPSKDSISLYATQDGGLTWTPVRFNGPQPKGLCGLQKVSDNFIVGCGRVRGPSYFIKTTDGGQNWYSYNLDHVAGSLIAAHFFNEDHGFLIGGTTRDKENSRSLVLETFDGGVTWDTAYISKQKGEYPWKFAFPSPKKGFISIQRNVKDGRFYHLQTQDGGKTWKEVEHVKDYYYVQGIGFANENIGFMGGESGVTYETRDGGDTWTRSRSIGSGFNNFQFLNDTMAYGVGFGVFKCNNIYSESSKTSSTYYEDGTVKANFTVRQGKKNGLAITYHSNGREASKGVFKNNLKNGNWKYFDQQGKLVQTIKMKNGQAKVERKKLQDYIGNYRTNNGRIRKVFLDGGQLYTQLEDYEKLIVFPESANRFFYAFNPEVTITFIQNDKGEVTHSQTYQRGSIQKAIKVKK